MVTVHREAGFRFIIFADDHEPAHVHVFGNGQAKINLAGADGAPELVSASGMKAGDLRKVMRIISEQQTSLLEQWEAYHG